MRGVLYIHNLSIDSLPLMNPKLLELFMDNLGCSRIGLVYAIETLLFPRCATPREIPGCRRERPG